MREFKSIQGVLTKYLIFQDVYSHRLLPHLIGTAEFLHDDTLGLTEYPSEDEKEDKNAEDEESDEDSEEEDEDETETDSEEESVSFN